MAGTRDLLKIDYHTDDDTGTYAVGEVDFGIYGTLDEYLKRYGLKGRDDIIGTLAYLIHDVHARFKDIKNEMDKTKAGSGD